MDFLASLVAWVNTAEASADVSVELSPSEGHPSKRSRSVKFESKNRIGQLTIWETGEVETIVANKAIGIGEDPTVHVDQLRTPSDVGLEVARMMNVMRSVAG